MDRSGFYSRRGARKQETKTIGDVVEWMKTLDPTKKIILRDLSGKHRDQIPCDLCSFRGDYTHASFMHWEGPLEGPYTSGAYEDEEFIFKTTGELLERIKYIVNNVSLTGYKGGFYRMYMDTPLWCADFGCSDSIGIDSFTVEENGDGVVLYREMYYN